MTNVLTIEVPNGEVDYMGRDNYWDLNDMFELTIPTNHETGEEDKGKEELVLSLIHI